MNFLLLFLIVVIAVFLASVIYYGGLNKVTIEEKTLGGELMVYEHYVGDYKQSTRIIDGIYRSLLKEQNLKTTQGVGIYYDDPKLVPIDELRSDLGVIVSGVSNAQLDEIKKSYEVKTLPTQNYITSSFPYKGRISIVISIFKVYTKLNAYVLKTGANTEAEVTEIYDSLNKKIWFRRPVN